MNKLPSHISLGQATEEVLRLKKYLSQNVVEIGAWIIKTRRDLLPKSEWLDWLKYEVKIPYTTAMRFIQVYEEVEEEKIDESTVEKLGFKKIADIIELPASKFRDDLIKAAPELSTQKVRELVDEAREVVGVLVKEEDNSQEKEIDIAIKAKADMVESLARIDKSKLLEWQKQYLESRLRYVPGLIIEFLEGILSET